MLFILILTKIGQLVSVILVFKFGRGDRQDREVERVKSVKIRQERHAAHTNFYENRSVSVYNFCVQIWKRKSHDSSVGIALGYGLDDWDSKVRFPAGAGNFSLHHRVQNGSGAHPASYPMGTRGAFPGSKAAGA
jgi:hypothetical protein